MPFRRIHPEFQFRSERDWGEVQTEDPTVLQLFCPETHTVLTLTMDDQGVPEDQFESTARALLASRKKGYVDEVLRVAGPGAKVDVSYSLERVEPHPSGTAFEVAYEAMHVGRSFLGFQGYVTSRKVVNLFVDTRLTYLPGRRGMFREVVAGFNFVLP
jgi:hypothetical protein